MRKIFQSPQSIRIAVFRVEYNPPAQTSGQSALTRYPELFREIRPYMCYRSDFHKMKYEVKILKFPDIR